MTFNCFIKEHKGVPTKDFVSVGMCIYAVCRFETGTINFSNGLSFSKSGKAQQCNQKGDFSSPLFGHHH
jgi:hypothetical protein